MENSNEQAIKAFRLLWCDSAGVRRCRVVPACRIESVVADGVGLTACCMAFPAHADIIVPESGLTASGEVRLVPDMPSAVRMDWAPTHRMCVSDMRIAKTGEPWSCCPRSALRGVVEKLKSVHGLELKVGFEIEFILLRRNASTGDVQPVDSLIYSQSRAFNDMAPVLDKMVAALSTMGIPVVQYHKESAPGQFEIVIQHADVCKAADQLLYTREAISGVASRHGLCVTFLPKYFPKAAGSGCHCHFSLWKNGQNIVSEEDGPYSVGDDMPTLSQTFSSFLAGILIHLPALLVFTTPSVNSFQRLAPGCWSGAYRVWGWDNREAPLRATFPPGGRAAANVELKAMDSTANPYLAMAALITAGVLGIEENSELPPPVQQDPASLTNLERSTTQASQLPNSLDLALEELFNDPSFHAALEENFGVDLLMAYTAVKRCEAGFTSKLGDIYLRY